MPRGRLPFTPEQKALSVERNREKARLREDEKRERLKMVDSILFIDLINMKRKQLGLPVITDHWQLQFRGKWKVKD